MKKPKLLKMVKYETIVDDYKKMFPEYDEIFIPGEYDISKSITHYEEMISDYKQQLKDLFMMENELFPDKTGKYYESFMLHKRSVRDSLNELSIILKELILEKSNNY